MTLSCLIVCWEYPPIVEGGLGRHVGGSRPGRIGFDLVHGHDWLVARAGEDLAGRLGCPLAATVELLLDDDELRERLVAAAIQHAAGFGWTALAARTAAVYRSLCPVDAPAMLGSGE